MIKYKNNIYIFYKWHIVAEKFALKEVAKVAEISERVVIKKAVMSLTNLQKIEGLQMLMKKKRNRVTVLE